MKLPKIVVAGPPGMKTTTIDDMEIPGVQTIEIVDDARDVTKVRLTIIADSIEYRDELPEGRKP